MNLKLFSVYAIACLVTSCSGGVADFEMQYFDLHSVISQSINRNLEDRPVFAKEVLIEREVEKITTNDIDWQKELEVFLTADLNKRDYLNKYSIDSSDRKLVYTLKENLDAPVKSLTITFDTLSMVKNVEAMLTTNNFLYNSERNLILNYKSGELHSYEVTGWQQLFIGNKKQYGIKAKKEGQNPS